MKKLFFTICFVILLSNVNFAQSKYRYGFHAGATYSSYRGNWVVEGNDPGFGVLAGLSFEYKIKNHISLVTNLSYETKVMTRQVEAVPQSPDDPYINVKATIIHSYLVLPILVKYSFGKNDSYFVNGGPFAGLLLKAVAKANGVDDSDVSDGEKKMDFGFTLGIGKTFRLKKNQEITVEIRDNLGLVDLSTGPVVGNGTVESNSLNLICGWSFDLK